MNVRDLELEEESDLDFFSDTSYEESSSDVENIEQPILIIKNYVLMKLELEAEK